MNTAEMAKLWLSKRDYKVSSGYTIDIENVLYQSFTNLKDFPLEKQRELWHDESFYKGAYILLPRGNDWSRIHRYIANLLRRD